MTASVAVLVFVAMTSAAFAQNSYYSSPRPGGGYNYYKAGGSSVGSSSPRPGGGNNYYNAGGSSAGYSTPRPGGGNNYYGSGKR